MMKNHVKGFGQFINESKQAEDVLVVNVDATRGISNSDIRKIEKLEPEQKVKLTGAVSSIASGLYGDLAKRKGNIYKAEEIQEWLKNINERAKGDYFQGGPKNPEIYGLHKRGSMDWHHPGEEDWNRITGEDPDEELSNQEFIDKYGEELDKAGHNFINQQPSDNRVKVWKNRNEPEPDTSLLPKRSASHLQPAQIREFITLLQRGMEKGEYLINRENSVAMIAHLKNELKGR